jgi:hypothetical protein
VGSLASLPSPNLEGQKLPLVWPVPFELTCVVLQGAYDPASTSLWVTGAHKSPLYEMELVLEEDTNFLIFQRLRGEKHTTKRSQTYILISEKKLRYVRFEVFTAVTMKNTVFWDVTP